MPTLIFRQVLEIHLHGKVIARLGSYNIGPVLALEDRLCAILDELGEAPHVYGDEDLGFGFGRRDVKGYAVEVGHDLVD